MRDEEKFLKYCKHCVRCNLYKTHKYKFERKTFSPGIQPMESISLDLKGQNKPTILTRTPICTDINMHAHRILVLHTFKNKKCQRNSGILSQIHSTFGTSRKVLSDNGTELKNKLFDKVADKLGIKRKIYRSQANGRIEGFHKYLKECIGKHI